MTEIVVHLDKNLEPNGKWVMTLIVEEIDNTTDTSKVLRQTSMWFEIEPQLQYRDWT